VTKNTFQHRYTLRAVFRGGGYGTNPEMLTHILIQQYSSISLQLIIGSLLH